MNAAATMVIRARLDDRPVRASTRSSGDTGAYVAVLATAIADVGLEIHSTYTGHPGAQTQAVHLLLAPGRSAETMVRSHSEHEIPVWAARGRCLLDHYAMLQRLTTLTGHTIAIDVDDALLSAVDLSPYAR